MTDEVALLEQAKIGLEPLEQFVDGAGPERAPDHGSRLQRRLLRRLQQIDASRQNRAHRVGYDELVGELVRGPTTVLPLEHADVDQRPNELLDEERIALRPLDHDLADACGKLGRNRGRRACEPHPRRRAPPARASRCRDRGRPSVGLLRTSSGRAVPSSSSGPRTSCSARLEQVEERVVSPVQVFDQHDRGSIGHELLEEPNPRLMQPVAGSQRVEVRRRLQPERHAQNLVLAEPAPHGLGRIALEQAEVLANDLTERACT